MLSLYICALSDVFRFQTLYQQCRCEIWYGMVWYGNLGMVRQCWYIPKWHNSIVCPKTGGMGQCNIPCSRHF